MGWFFFFILPKASYVHVSTFQSILLFLWANARRHLTVIDQKRDFERFKYPGKHVIRFNRRFTTSLLAGSSGLKTDWPSCRNRNHHFIQSYLGYSSHSGHSGSEPECPFTAKQIKKMEHTPNNQLHFAEAWCLCFLERTRASSSTCNQSYITGSWIGKSERFPMSW